MRNPYSSFELFASALNAILITASVLGASEAEAAIRAATTQPAALFLAYALYGVIPFIIWIAATYLIASFLFKRTFVRKKLLSACYVEGTWIENVRLTDGSVGTAVICIAPDGDTFGLSGKTYDDNGDLSSSFVADYHQIRWPILQYKHSNQSGKGKTGEGRVEGIAELSFETLSVGVPSYYTGFFHHVGRRSRNQTEAWRVKDEEVHMLEQPSTRLQLIEEYRRAARVRVC